MPRSPNVEPKPFVLVPIPSEGPKRQPPVTHERFFDLTGHLGLTFTVVSEYLFVGSGAYDFDPNARGDRPDVWYTFYRRNDQMCVPGTSIKGAVRAIVEAISNSCVSQTRRKRSSEEQVRSSSHRPCQFKDITSSLCPACRLFGTTGYRGRVHFSDFLPRGEVTKGEIVKIGELWEPKKCDSTKRRFYGQKSFQRAGDLRPTSGFRFVEAVRKETEFQGTLVFENLKEAELGLLFHALGWAVEEGSALDSRKAAAGSAQNTRGEQGKVITAFYPKIGGAKPRCFGSVQFNYQTARLRLWHGNLAGLLASQELIGNNVTRFFSRCIQESKKGGFLHSESWETLVKECRLRNETCPKGVY